MNVGTTPAMPEQTAGHYRHERILIADDDPQVCRLLARILDVDRYPTATVSNGEEAIAILESEDVTLIITDLAMPKLNGHELINYAHRHYPGLPCIVISGKNDVEDAVQCIREGAVDYISKPFQVNQIRNAVAKALQNSQTMRRQEALSAVTQLTPPKESLAGYDIIDTLGEGTMGTVLLAERKIDGQIRQYAIKVMKVLPADPRKREQILARFMREAQVLSNLNHSSIVSFVEYGLAYDQTVPYIVMDYIQGRPLRDYIRQDMGINITQKVRLIRETADALVAIHAQEVCHRDIKPDNIIITPDLHAVLTDFGVVRIPESALTLTSQFVGSPAYLSPEGYRCGKVDERSDLFSLGVVAYELLAGRKPFLGENISELSRRIMHESPVSPRRLRPDIPQQLESILDQMLRKEPDKRYQTATDLLQDLDTFLNQYQQMPGIRRRAASQGYRW